MIRQTLRVIEEKVDSFNKTYIIVPNFISDVVVRVKSIAETATQVLTSDSTSDPERLSSCLDNYVSGLAHHKVFNAAKSICRTSDADLERCVTGRNKEEYQKRCDFTLTSRLTLYMYLMKSVAWTFQALGLFATFQRHAGDARCSGGMLSL